MQFYSQEQYDEYQRDLEGDGYSNEYQRCAAQQLLERPLRNERPRADRLTKQGKFVILCEFARLCRVTDGILGAETVIHRVYDSEAEAQAELAKYVDNDCNGDVELYIYRLPMPAPAPEVPEFDDEVPF